MKGKAKNGEDPAMAISALSYGHAKDRPAITWQAIETAADITVIHSSGILPVKNVSNP